MNKRHLGGEYMFRTKSIKKTKYEVYVRSIESETFCYDAYRHGYKAKKLRCDVDFAKSNLTICGNREREKRKGVHRILAKYIYCQHLTGIACNPLLWPSARGVLFGGITCGIIKVETRSASINLSSAKECCFFCIEIDMFSLLKINIADYGNFIAKV